MERRKKQVLQQIGNLQQKCLNLQYPHSVFFSFLSTGLQYTLVTAMIDSNYFKVYID